MTTTRVALVCMAALFIAAGCESQANTLQVATTPTPSADSVARAYVDLVDGFWHDHVTATSGAQQVCIDAVNPPLCKARGVAMLAAQQKFADDLAKTPAPAKFTSQDKTIRLDLPVTLSDLTAMVGAASASDKAGVHDDALKYILDMQPILEAFDQIQPAVQHV